MSGELPFIDLDGVELANAYRTLEYLRRGLGAVNWQVPEVYPCAILGREVGGVAPFISPAVDPAPWYDASVPESGEFLGMIVKLDFQTLKVSRTISQRFGGIGGGVIGVEQVQARGVDCEAMLIASSCAGLEYGRHWVYARLGADCAGCSLGLLRVRESCPPDEGGNDTRGERFLYDTALVDGITRTDQGGAMCCDYDGIHFALASQSPYLYSRPTAISAVQQIGDGWDAMPPQPAVIDTFVRANTGPPPSGSWTGPIQSGEGNTLRVLSNVLDNSVHTGGTTGSAYWNAATFGPDVAVTVVVPTHPNGGQFELRARITNPGAALTDYIYARVIFGAGAALDAAQVGRVTDSNQTNTRTDTQMFLVGAQTFAAGDTFALVGRGSQIECWRKPSGGSWTRIAAAYDPYPAITSGYVGVAIIEQGATQTLSTLSAGTLVNGSYYPKTVYTLPMPAQSIGVLSPIVTLHTYGWDANAVAAGGVRVQVKAQDGGECSQTDSFTVDDLSTRWTQSPGGPWYQITGGKLKPLSVFGLLVEKRVSRRSATGAAIAWYGGRVEATIKTGATLTNGVWGVALGSNIGAYLVRVVNDFRLSNAANGSVSDSMPFTPVAGATYRIVLEVEPNADGTFDVRGWLLDANNQMQTRPLRATFPATIVGPMAPAINSISADTAEEWDSFYAIDSSAPAQYMDVAIEPGDIVINTPRRGLTFTSTASTGVVKPGVEASGKISTPLDTPLGWPDVCAGDGAQCLQVWGHAVAWQQAISPVFSTNFKTQTQQRVR